MTTINNDRWERIEELHQLMDTVQTTISNLQRNGDYARERIAERTPEEIEEHTNFRDYDKEEVAESERKIAYWTDLVPRLENLIYGVPSK